MSSRLGQVSGTDLQNLLPVENRDKTAFTSHVVAAGDKAQVLAAGPSNSNTSKVSKDEKKNGGLLSSLFNAINGTPEGTGAGGVNLRPALGLKPMVTAQPILSTRELSSRKGRNFRHNPFMRPTGRYGKLKKLDAEKSKPVSKPKLEPVTLRGKNAEAAINMSTPAREARIIHTGPNKGLHTNGYGRTDPKAYNELKTNHTVNKELNPLTPQAKFWKKKKAQTTLTL